jgi:hypothetical protein
LSGDGGSGDLGEVEFPDGTHITDPYQDSNGYVYDSHDDWVHGADKYELESSGSSDDSSS